MTDRPSHAYRSGNTGITGVFVLVLVSLPALCALAQIQAQCSAGNNNPEEDFFCQSQQSNPQIQNKASPEYCGPSYE